MPVGSIGLPFKLNSKDLGLPNYAEALYNTNRAREMGHQATIRGAEAANAPQKLAAELLAKHLQNKINQPKADYAKDITLADLENTRAGTRGLNEGTLKQHILNQFLGQREPAEIDLIKAHGRAANQTYEQNQSFADALKNARNGYQQNNNSTNNYAPITQEEANGEALNQPQPKGLDRLGNMGAPTNNPNVMAQGNPELKYIDEMYDKHPEYRKKLEAAGYKQTQTTKFDPKTGTSTVITTKPSGEVQIHTNKPQSTGYTPLTQKTASQHQTVISAAENAIPDIDKLLKLDIPKQGVLSVFHPENQSTYADITGGLIESLLAAFNLPKTESGIKKIEDKILRHANESEKHYKDRLRETRKELAKRANNSRMALDRGVNLSQLSEEASSAISTNKELTFNPATGDFE